MSNQLSDYLFKIRQEKKISLAQLSKGTGVSEKNLKLLEEGDFDSLPPDIYIRGYLYKISENLGLDFSPLWHLYESSRTSARFSGSSDIFPSNNIFLNTRRLLLIGNPFKVIGWLFLIISFSAYIFWQADKIFGNPVLEITSPDLDAAFVNPDLEIVGKTNASEIIINEKPILIAKDGIFKTSFNLMPGLNIIEFKAKNKFGKMTIIEKRVMLK